MDLNYNQLGLFNTINNDPGPFRANSTELLMQCNSDDASQSNLSKLDVHSMMPIEMTGDCSAHFIDRNHAYAGELTLYANDNVDADFICQLYLNDTNLIKIMIFGVIESIAMPRIYDFVIFNSIMDAALNVRIKWKFKGYKYKIN